MHRSTCTRVLKYTGLKADYTLQLRCGCGVPSCSMEGSHRLSHEFFYPPSGSTAKAGVFIYVYAPGPVGTGHSPLMWLHRPDRHMG